MKKFIITADVIPMIAVLLDARPTQAQQLQQKMLTPLVESFRVIANRFEKSTSVTV